MGSNLVRVVEHSLRNRIAVEEIIKTRAFKECRLPTHYFLRGVYN
jgi:hypothetical protein